MADYDISPITSAVGTGIGMYILAGTAMRTMDMMDRGYGRRYKPISYKPKVHKGNKRLNPKSMYRWY